MTKRIIMCLILFGIIISTIAISEVDTINKTCSTMEIVGDLDTGITINGAVAEVRNYLAELKNKENTPQDQRVLATYLLLRIQELGENGSVLIQPLKSKVEDDFDLNNDTMTYEGHPDDNFSSERYNTKYINNNKG